MTPDPDTYTNLYGPSVKFLNWGGRTRRFLRRRDGDNCWICGEEMDFQCDTDRKWAATIEHVLPVSRGGNDNRNNLALSHQVCNSTRGLLDGHQVRYKIEIKEVIDLLFLKGKFYL